MKALRQFSASSPEEQVEEEISEKNNEAFKSLKQSTNKIILKNNPKIDQQLIADYERLITSSKGVIRIKQGADYHLSHPLGSNDLPTDPREIGKRLGDVKRT
jgi:P2-related tail formation protein